MRNSMTAEEVAEVRAVCKKYYGTDAVEFHLDDRGQIECWVPQPLDAVAKLYVCWCDGGVTVIPF